MVLQRIAVTCQVTCQEPVKSMVQRAPVDSGRVLRRNIVPCDADGKTDLSVAQVCVYYKHLLTSGARKTYYAVKYHINKSYGGYAAGLANATSDFESDSESDSDSS